MVKWLVKLKFLFSWISNDINFFEGSSSWKYSCELGSCIVILDNDSHGKGNLLVESFVAHVICIFSILEERFVNIILIELFIIPNISCWPVSNGVAEEIRRDTSNINEKEFTVSHWSNNLSSEMLNSFSFSLLSNLGLKDFLMEFINGDTSLVVEESDSWWVRKLHDAVSLVITKWFANWTNLSKCDVIPCSFHSLCFCFICE